LPNLNERFIEGISSDLSVGTYVEAGLPNISGYIGDGSGDGDNGGFLLVRGSESTGVLSSTSNIKLAGLTSGSAYGFNKISFDASKSNPIYGNSDTV
jgi:hypothetical protein